MNLEDWPQNRRMIPISSPHQIPRHHHDLMNAGSPGCGASLAPPRDSKNCLNQVNRFIIQPSKSRRKKKHAVGKSMQKNAQPRFTVTKVIAQPRNCPANDGAPADFLQRDHNRWVHNNIPCHNPQTTKFRPAPCQSPLKNMVISTLT